MKTEKAKKPRSGRGDVSERDYVDHFFDEWRSRPDGGRYSDPATAFLFRALRLAADLERSLGEACGAAGITVSQFQALVALKRLSPKPLTAAEVMRHSVLTSGSVTSMIDQLQGKGLVEKSQDGTDRRVARISLTEKGRRLIEPLLQARLSELRDLAHELPASERTSVSRALRKLLLSRQDGGAGPKS